MAEPIDPQNAVAPTGTTLRDALGVLRRRKWVVILCTVLVPAAALGFSLLQDPAYQGQADVLLSQKNLANSLTDTQEQNIQGSTAERMAQTQAELAATPEVASRTLDALDITDMTPQDLLDETDISSSQNSDILVFKVTDGDRTRAGQLANEYADQYTKYRTEIDTAAINRALDEVDRRLNAEDAEGGDSGSLRSTLIEKREQLRTLQALQTSNAFVVRTETLAEQVKPTPLRNTVLGLILGLMLGVALAFAFDALDTRLRNAEQISAALGAPLLSRIPLEGRVRGKGNRAPLMIRDPNAPDTESYRVLRSNLEFASLGNDARVVMFTSAIENEGKSTTVANLAVACARASKRVVLVDLDLRRPSLEKTFDLLPRPGITNIAVGGTTLEQAFIRLQIGESTGVNGKSADGAPGGGLWLLPGGAIPPDPGEFVSTEALAHVIDQLREQFDLVLIDTSPILRVGDPMTLAKRVDGVVVVGRQGMLRAGMAREVHRLLDASPAKLLGVVVIGGDGAARGYGYGYGYGYEGDAPAEALELEKS